MKNIKNILLVMIIGIFLISFTSAMTANYTNTYFNFSSQTTTPISQIWLGNNGTKLYIVERGVNPNFRVLQYNLTTAWNVSSAIYTGKSITTSGTSNPIGMTLSNNGSRVYYLTATNGILYYWDLSIPWELDSTGSKQSGFNVRTGTVESSSRNLFFKPDGTMLYSPTNTNGYVNQYILSTPWDATTGTYQTYFNASAQGNTNTGIAFNKNGTKMFLLKQDKNTIFKYDLSTPWNVSTAIYNGVLLNISSQATATESIYFSPEQDYFYVVGNDQKSIYQYYIDDNSPTINVLYPTPIINYSRLGGNLNLNVSTSDINLDSCWYNYNGTNISTTCNTNTSFTLGTQKSLTYYANDTYGNLASKIISLDYKIFGNSQTYNNITTEGNNELFRLNISLNESYSIEQANLIYDSEEYSIDLGSGNNPIILEKNIIIPGVSADQNKTFYWSIELDDGLIVNTTSTNQTVINIIIANCSTYTNNIYNFLLKDEELQTAINDGKIETEFNLYSQNGEEMVLNFSQEFNSTNIAQICLNTNLQNASRYSLDVIVKYNSPIHAIEYYNIINATITNSTGTQNITLYDLLLDDSTDFQLTFTGTDFLPESGVLVYVEREYISEGIFKTIEVPETDTNGQTVLHLVRNDVRYNLRFVKDGVVLKTFLKLIAFCNDLSIGDCRINLNAISNITEVLNYNEELGIIYEDGPSYNDTDRKISFSYVSYDGSPKEVTIRVERNDVFGNRSICNNTVTSASGVLQCGVPSGIEDTNLIIYIDVGEETVLLGNIEMDTSAYGNMGYVLWFILALGLVLMFSKDKNGILLALLISYFGAVSLGLVIGGIAGVGSAGIWIIIITLIGLWKLNKNKIV